MSEPEPCGCWMAPNAYLHAGHCCFDDADATCHRYMIERVHAARRTERASDADT